MTTNYIDPEIVDPKSVAMSPDRVGYAADLDETAKRLALRPWPTRPLQHEIAVSFEYFPPSSEPAGDALVDCAHRLDDLDPAYVSVTYGAGGSNRDRTFATIERLHAEVRSPVAGHLTTVGATKAETLSVIDRYLELGVRHIVALRGDEPADAGRAANGTGVVGYRSAAELVAAIRARSPQHTDDHVTISVAAYPEVHPKAESAEADLAVLIEKIDAGADQAITQFFYDNSTYLEFLGRCREAGITAPILAGIMPVTSFKRVSSFAARCGTSIPSWMSDLYRGLDDAPDVHQLVSATLAAEQCRELAEHGVRHFHFYTMNRPELTLSTCRVLGLVGPLGTGHTRAS